MPDRWVVRHSLQQTISVKNDACAAPAVCEDLPVVRRFVPDRHAVREGAAARRPRCKSLHDLSVIAIRPRCRVQQTDLTPGERVQHRGMLVYRRRRLLIPLTVPSRSNPPGGLV